VMPKNRYSVEVAYRSASKFADAVREFERLMKEAMVHGGLSHEEAFWYVSTITKESK
jgi:hypothetical protein